MLGSTIGKVCIIRGDARALPLRSADVVITSPPFAGNSGGQGEASRNPINARYPGLYERNSGGKVGKATYTRPPAQVDAAIFSPPYERQDTSAHPGQLEGILHTMGRANRHGTGHEGAENIGNLKKDAYWSAISQVYAECWRVLKPGGIMALVLKGFTHDGKYVDLPGQTETLLLAAGWLKHDHWKRELYSLSFWRILQRRRDPVAFDERLWFEEILAFRKPEGAGDGVAAILTSPPFGDVNARSDADQDWRERAEETGRLPKMGNGLSKTVRYTRPVSLIVTSPPYEATDITKPIVGTTQGNATHKDGLQRRYTRPGGAP